MKRIEWLNLLKWLFVRLPKRHHIWHRTVCHQIQYHEPYQAHVWMICKIKMELTVMEHIKQVVAILIYPAQETHSRSKSGSKMISIFPKSIVLTWKKAKHIQYRYIHTCWLHQAGKKVPSETFAFFFVIWKRKLNETTHIETNTNYTKINGHNHYLIFEPDILKLANLQQQIIVHTMRDIFRANNRIIDMDKKQTTCRQMIATVCN